VLAGDADFYERFTLDDVAEVAKSSEVKVVPSASYTYTVLEFNHLRPDGKGPHPVLASTGVRRALTMAVDRAALERNVFDTLGRPALGPFSRSQWTADTTVRPLPYDTVAAAALLDSLGWKRGADGMRSRGGQPLAFSISVSSSSGTNVRYAELLQQSFARAGAKVAVDQLDQPGLIGRIVQHTFESAILNWTATPSPSGTRQLWGTRTAATSPVQNAGSWSNATFDAHIDTALTAMTPAAVRAHFKVAYQTAIDDPPALWLYEPKLVPGMSKRLVTGPFRVDAWWQSIPGWDVIAPARKAPGGAAAPATKP
jgi:peptide/nickel transport system substrate-binding protein